MFQYMPMQLWPFDKAIENIMNGIRDILQGWVLSNLEDMLITLNERVGTITGELTTAPSDWLEGTVWKLILNIAQDVALPIAGTIFLLVVIWELISMLTAGNNFGDVDVLSQLFKWFIKVMVASWFIVNSINICNCFFALGAHMVSTTNSTLSVYTGNVTNETSDKIQEFFNTQFGEQDEAASPTEIGNLLKLGLTTALLSFMMNIMGLLITIILYSRMISIYLHCAVAPIPIATLTNQHLQQHGMGFLRSVFALAMQAVVMMICVAIYGALIANIIDPSEISAAAGNTASATYVLQKVIFECVCLSILLIYAMFSSERVTKTIFGIQ